MNEFIRFWVKFNSFKTFFPYFMLSIFNANGQVKNHRKIFAHLKFTLTYLYNPDLNILRFPNEFLAYFGFCIIECKKQYFRENVMLEKFFQNVTATDFRGARSFSIFMNNDIYTSFC